MRKIAIESWKEKDREGNDVDVDLVSVLTILLGNKKPEEIPRGLDKFRLFNRLAKAFDKAKDKKILELEEGDYSFLKKMVESDIPCLWGMNVHTSKAVEDFLEAKGEDQRE